MQNPGNLSILNLGPEQEHELTQEKQREVDFVKTLAATRTAFVTPILIAINVLVFAIMVVKGVSLFEPTIDSLLRWGADFGPLTTHGQWWRLFTSMFVHIGVIHVVMNMAVFAQIGVLTERLFGNIGFLVLYLLAGIGGSLVSLAMHPFTVSAGASGAIFGIYGGLLGFLLLQRRLVPSETLSSLSKSALIFVGFNVVYGMGKGQIDMAAHFGGLAAGFVVGCALAQPLGQVSAASRAIRIIVVTLVGGVLAVVGAQRLPVTEDLLPEISRFASIESRLIDLSDSSVKKWTSGTLTAEECAQILEQKVLPEWNAERETISKYKNVSPQQRTIATALIDYMAARADAWTLLAQGARKNDAETIQKAVARKAEADKLASTIGQ